MPLYSYRNGKHVVEHWIHDHNPPRLIRIDGKLYARDIAADFKSKPVQYSGWPMYSDSLGVHPKEIAEKNEALARAGINAKHMPDGRLKIENSRIRKECMKHYGYSDWAGYD